MGTPILSKKQQKSTLSAKKFNTREILRNVLSSPYKDTFWPAISNEGCVFFKKALEDNLPKIKSRTINVPWQELRHVAKHDRKQYRREYCKINSIGEECNEEESDGLCLGINDVSKYLENDSLGAVLIADGVQPKLMVQHLIDQAIFHKVPVLVVDNLKNMLKIHCGITSVALGIKKTLPLASKLNTLVSCIETLIQDYPVYANHINHKRCNDISQMESTCDEEHKHKRTKVEIDEDIIGNSHYLMKTSKGKRMFIPETVTQSSKMEVDVKLFHAFSEEILEETLISYKPLKVKRLKDDTNRKNRIIQSLKQI